MLFWDQQHVLLGKNTVSGLTVNIANLYKKKEEEKKATADFAF